MQPYKQPHIALRLNKIKIASKKEKKNQARSYYLSFWEHLG